MFCVQPVCIKDVSTGLQVNFLRDKLSQIKKKKKVGEHSPALLRSIRQWPLTKDNPQLCTIL